MPSQTPAPPEYLAEPTQAWWRSVMADYTLEPHHIRLLTLAAECWDRAQEARWHLQFEGLTVAGKDGPRPHPAVKIHTDATTLFARLIRELDLDCEPPPDNRVGPKPLKSNRG